MDGSVRAHHHLIILPVLPLEHQLAQHGAEQVGRGHRQVGDVHAVRAALLQHQGLCQQVLDLCQGKLAHAYFRVDQLCHRRCQIVNLRRGDVRILNGCCNNLRHLGLQVMDLRCFNGGLANSRCRNSRHFGSKILNPYQVEFSCYFLRLYVALRIQHMGQAVVGGSSRGNGRQ